MSSQPLVHAVVLNYNNKQGTIAAVESLQATSYGNMLIHVIDNASPDSSGAHLQEWTTRLGEQCAVRVRCTLLPTNGGYAAGNNHGISVAAAAGAKYVYVLNHDAVVAEDSLRTFVDIAESDAKVGAVGAILVESTPAGDRIQAVGGARFLLSRTTAVRAGEGQIPTDLGLLARQFEPWIDHIAGSSIFLRMEALRACGSFAPEFFLFCEEVELCRRLGRGGYSLRVAPTVVQHERGAVSGAVASLGSKAPQAAYFGARSLVMLARLIGIWYVPYALCVRIIHALVVSMKYPRLGWAAVRGLAAGLAAPLPRAASVRNVIAYDAGVGGGRVD